MFKTFVCFCCLLTSHFKTICNYFLETVLNSSAWQRPYTLHPWTEVDMAAIIAQITRKNRGKLRRKAKRVTMCPYEIELPRLETQLKQCFSIMQLYIWSWMEVAFGYSASKIEGCQMMKVVLKEVIFYWRVLKPKAGIVWSTSATQFWQCTNCACNN